MKTTIFVIALFSCLSVHVGIQDSLTEKLLYFAVTQYGLLEAVYSEFRADFIASFSD
jgi:hypothetical protein